MPSESDNKMEELLKAYARKRRQDAGASLELHPATRQLLQAEVKRLQQPTTGPAPSGWRMLFLFWPRVAFATMVFVALGVVGWGILRSQQNARLAKSEKAFTLAKRLETTTTTPAPADRPESLDVSRRRLAEDEERQLARIPTAPAPTVADKFESWGEKAPAARAPKDGPTLKQLNGEMSRADAGRVEVDKGAPAREREVFLQRDALAEVGQKIEINGKGTESRSAGLAPSTAAAPSPNRAESPLVATAPMANTVKLKADLKPTPVLPEAIPPNAARADLDAARPPTALPFEPLSAKDGYALAVPTSSAGTVAGFQFGPTNSISMNWALTPAPAAGSTFLYGAGGGGRIGMNTNSAVAANSITPPNLFYAGVSPTPALTPSPALQPPGESAGQSPAVALAAKPVTDQQSLGRLAKQPAPTSAAEYSKKQLPGVAAVDALNQPASLATPNAPAQVPSQLTGPASQVAAANSRQYGFRSQVARPAPATGRRRVMPALLNSFQFEQKGDRIQIVDGDNSVYEGQVVTAAPATPKQAAPAAAETEMRRSLMIEQKSKETKQVNEAAASTLLPVSFRASGTNVTTKQLVIIEATLMPLSQESKTAELAGELARAQSVSALGAAVKVGPPSVRVQGRARLGTNELPIDALGTATQR